MQNPAACTTDANLTADPNFPGVAYKPCSSDEAALEGHLPTTAYLLRTLPQLSQFYSLIRISGVNNIPGTDITLLAPSDDAFQAALSSGLLTQNSLKDPAMAQHLVLAHVVPSGGYLSTTLEGLGKVMNAENDTLMVGKDAQGASQALFVSHHG